MSERRFQYEADVKRDPLNYDAWFDYIRLEESAGQPARVRARGRVPAFRNPLDGPCQPPAESGNPVKTLPGCRSPLVASRANLWMVPADRL